MGEMRKFCKDYGISEQQFYGREAIRGSLFFSGLTSIPAGFNPTVDGDLDLSSLASIPEGFSPTVGGSFILYSATEIPEGVNPAVGGSLYLSRLASMPENCMNSTVGGDLLLQSLTSIPEGFNPIVGGHLFLNSLAKIPGGFSPTVGGNLNLDSLAEIPDGFNPTVGCDLDLSSLAEISGDFNVTVGRNLKLDSLTSIPEDFNPTVGGHLFLNSVAKIPDRFSPTVGGKLYLNNLAREDREKVQHTPLPSGYAFFWQNGKYIKADGIFSEVVSRRGNMYRTKRIGKDRIEYLATDGKGKWAHGSSLKEAQSDLMYKIADRDKSRYKKLTLDSVLSLPGAIEAYRVITGACAAGVRAFVNSIDAREQYSVLEIIEATTGRYGNKEFAAFFKARSIEGQAT